MEGLDSVGGIQLPLGLPSRIDATDQRDGVVLQSQIVLVVDMATES